MSTESDAKRFVRAAEFHFNAGDSTSMSLVNKKDAIMLELCKKYFMTGEEKMFYDLLLSSESKIAMIYAASYAERLRYDLENILSLVERIKKEGWVFSEDSKKQNESSVMIYNITRFTKESIIKQQKFNDDRLFRQISKYLFLLSAYDDEWTDFKPEKAAERWKELLRYVDEQIVKEGKQEKFFNDIYTNYQPFQKLITAMVGAAIGYDVRRSIEVLEDVILNGRFSPRYKKFAENQLNKIRNNETLDGLEVF